MRSPSVILALLLGVSSGAMAGGQASSGLLGEWRGEDGEPVLIFDSPTRLRFNSEVRAYSRSAGRFLVQEEGGVVAYPYVLEGGQLKIAFPGEGVVVFRRSAKSAAVKPAGGQEYLVQGSFCSYSGSSNYSGSYSSSRKAFFDGRGRFATGGESSFNTTLYDGGTAGGGVEQRGPGGPLPGSGQQGVPDSVRRNHRRRHGEHAPIRRVRVGTDVRRHPLRQGVVRVNSTLVEGHSLQ